MSYFLLKSSVTHSLMFAELLFSSDVADDGADAGKRKWNMHFPFSYGSPGLLPLPC